MNGKTQTESEQAETNKVQRITAETRGLVEDIKSWVDLRMQLTQMEVEGRLNGAIYAVFILMALFFALIAAGFGLGAWMGSTALGFLAVSGIIVLVTALLRLFAPQFVKIGRDPAKKR